LNRRELCTALGAAAASPVLARLPATARWAVGRRAHARAQGRALAVLDPHEAETVGVIAEMIIPETDTPGAGAAHIPEFADLMLAEWSSEDERTRFRAGLADVDARSRAAFGADFVAGTDAQRAAILTTLDAEVQAAQRAQAQAPQRPRERMPEQPFFQRLKALTVYGYYTSKVGATQELHFEAVPGSFDHCTDVHAARVTPGDF
jgi:gluconate 2-dehydrogenase gamma chain